MRKWWKALFSQDCLAISIIEVRNNTTSVNFIITFPYHTFNSINPCNTQHWGHKQRCDNTCYIFFVCACILHFSLLSSSQAIYPCHSSKRHSSVLYSISSIQWKFNGCLSKWSFFPFSHIPFPSIPLPDLYPSPSP